MKAINRTTNEITLYHSTYYAQQCLRVNADNAKIVCEGINNCKSGKSKKDSCNYEFKYIEEKRHE